MKSVYLLILVTTISTVGFSQSLNSKILGHWLNDDGTSQIEIFQKDDKYFGKIIWLKEPNQPNGKPKVDKNNPNPALREKPIVGLEIITDLEFINGNWVNGTIYSPKEGQTVNSSMLLLNENILKVTASKFLFSTTKIWKRL